VTAEIELMELISAAGINRALAIALITEIKQDAVAEDNAFEQQVSNLKNAKDEAVEALQSVLYNLRNA
jgi:Holliday junction resolvasome RuvABC DNA-binding subunit